MFIASKEKRFNHERPLSDSFAKAIINHKIYAFI